MIANLFDRNMVKVLSYFLISPGSRYRRKELKEKTEMNNIPLDTTLQQLLSLKIIKEKKHVFELNFENKDLIDIIMHLKKEYTSFNVPHLIFNLIVDLSAKLSKEKSVQSAILFGSYAKLIHTKKSDIDIAVILSNALKNPSFLEKKIQSTTEKIEKKYKKNIELHFLSDKDLVRKDPLMQEIKRNGKELF